MLILPRGCGRAGARAHEEDRLEHLEAHASTMMSRPAEIARCVRGYRFEKVWNPTIIRGEMRCLGTVIPAGIPALRAALSENASGLIDL